MNTVFESELQATESEVSESRGRIVSLQNNDDNPLSMLRTALASGQDPEKLHRLMDLCERFKAERAAEQFSTSLNDCQRLMPCVVKDAVNEFTKKRYSTLENLITTIRPVYTQAGFSLSFGTEDSKLADHVRIYCDIRHVGGHKERHQLDLPLDSVGAKGGSNKSPAQATGSTLTYGRRYLTGLIFNVVVADEDLDGNSMADLETITDSECLNVEDLIKDSGTNRDRFLQWLKTAEVLVGDVAEVRKISQRGLAKVLHTLTMKLQENERKKAGSK